MRQDVRSIFTRQDAVSTLKRQDVASTIGVSFSNGQSK